jgi:hypothetical protein
MIAAATLIVGIVREVMSWATYDLSLLEQLPIPVIAGVTPGKHTTRKGWLTKDFHYEQSPYTSDVNAPLWTTQHGETKSLREIARDTAWCFRRSIRRFSDPFSFRLLFAVLEGRAPSMLELVDRPSAYEDVGRLCKWGMVIHELKTYESEMRMLAPWREWNAQSIDQFVLERQEAREKHHLEMANVSADEPLARTSSVREENAKESPQAALLDDLRPRHQPRRATQLAVLSRRRSDRPGKLVPKRPPPFVERRAISLLGRAEADGQVTRERRRNHERRRNSNRFAIPFPDRRLTRSAYEQVFLKLVSGGHLRMGNDVYTPVGMKGWYHAIFRRDSDGAERLLTIDQLLKKMGDWT